MIGVRARRMLFELRGLVQNQLLGIGPVRRPLHRLGSTGMNGDAAVAEARFQSYRRHVAIEGKSVLELGPGHTPEVLLLAREQGAARCVGLDIEHHVDPADARRRGVELDLYDGKRMPYADDTFDVVWSSDVFEHVRAPRYTLTECVRVLRPGGTFAAAIDLRDHYFLHRESDWLNCLRYSETMWRAMSWNRSSFVNRLRASEWVTLLEECGLSIMTFEKLQSEVLRDVYRRGAVRSHKGPLGEDDAATYRLEVVAVKGAAA